MKIVSTKSGSGHDDYTEYKERGVMAKEVEDSAGNITIELRYFHQVGKKIIETPINDDVLALHGFTQENLRDMYNANNINIAGNSVTTYAIINDQKVFFRYGHSSQPVNHAIGSFIPGGGKIGPVGTTGKSTGNHAHVEIWVDQKPTTTNPFLFYQIGNRYYLHPTYFNRYYLGGNGR